MLKRSRARKVEQPPQGSLALAEVTVSSFSLSTTNLIQKMKISEALDTCRKYLTQGFEESNTIRTPYIVNALMKAFANGEVPSIVVAQAQNAFYKEIYPCSLLVDHLWVRGKIPERYVERPYKSHPIKVEINVYNPDYVNARNEWLRNFIIKLEKDNQ